MLKKKKKYKKRFRVLRIHQPSLVKWLREQGAPDYASRFVLEGGMGESLELSIPEDDVVEIRIYGASHDR